MAPARLARTLRDDIESGEHQYGDVLRAADLADQHGVSIRVTWNALTMLAANRYIIRLGNFNSYHVIWRAGV